MEFSGCISMMQGYLENSPLIVLGSGASAPYGLPTMRNLADRIKENDQIKKDPLYEDFCAQLDANGLEKAIDAIPLQDSTLQAVRMVTWEAVNKCDQCYLESNNYCAPAALTELLEKIIAPTPNKAAVVTTNYDRLAEYAADKIGATTVTGFEGAFLKRLELPSNLVNSKRIKARERTVNVWKVHGSLDWFSDSEGNIICLPFSKSVPMQYSPLIVPPGKDKYSSTHNEPYRTIITEADKAFTQAGAYLCVGYGFNDEHIQPKLLAQIESGKPIVILARTMTEACKRHIIESNVKKYLIFEKSDDSHTIVYGNGWSEIYDGQYWNLDGFLKVW